MYSVTVANYPHWVEFDANDEVSIKGFKYMPRQDGPNGNIKGYKLEVSVDGTPIDFLKAIDNLE